MAITLRRLRSGRTAMLTQNICARENGPSYVSVIEPNWICTLSFPFCHGQNCGRRSKPRAEFAEEHFWSVKFSTQVLIRLWKSFRCQVLTSPSSTFFPALHHFRAMRFLLRRLLSDLTFDASPKAVGKKISAPCRRKKFFLYNRHSTFRCYVRLSTTSEAFQDEL